MSWTEKEKPTSFDDQPIPGMFYLDGDVVAEFVGRDWTRGEKYPDDRFSLWGGARLMGERRPGQGSYSASLW